MADTCKISYRFHELRKLNITNLGTEVVPFIEDTIMKGNRIPDVIMTYNKDESFTIITGGSIISTVLNSKHIRVKKEIVNVIEFNSYEDQFDEDYFKQYLEMI